MCQSEEDEHPTVSHPTSPRKSMSLLNFFGFVFIFWVYFLYHYVTTCWFLLYTLVTDLKQRWAPAALITVMDVNLNSANYFPHYFKNKDIAWPELAWSCLPVYFRPLFPVEVWNIWQLLICRFSRKSDSTFRKTAAVTKAYEKRVMRLMWIMYKRILVPYNLKEYIMNQSQTMVPPSLVIGDFWFWQHGKGE